MIRAFLVFVLFLLVYHAIKTLFRSAVDAYGRPEDSRRLPGEEMVLDPQCRTYIVKDRSVARRINGATVYFCSAECADKYERARR